MFTLLPCAVELKQLKAWQKEIVKEANFLANYEDVLTI
jgi:hypothetical protein